MVRQGISATGSRLNCTRLPKNFLAHRTPWADVESQVVLKKLQVCVLCEKTVVKNKRMRALTLSALRPI